MGHNAAGCLRLTGSRVVACGDCAYSGAAAGSTRGRERLADVFISYARADREVVAALSAALEQAGYSVWWDRHIGAGAAFAQAIEAELESAKAVIVAWSKSALTSDWVKDEAAAARDQGKLVPVSLDGAVAPLGFRQYHVIDLSAWVGDGATPVPEDLLRSLESRVSGTPSQTQPATGDRNSRSAAASPARPAARSTRGRMIAGLGLAVLVVATTLAYRWHAGRDAADPATASNAGPASAPATQSLDKSIAVLPFENRSAQADDAYFAAGMHDDLLAQLSRVGDLRVTSRTSVMRYADTDKPIPQIARELGVGAVLEGGVQRAGNRVRINVQLIDGRTDSHLWSETFDRELTVANLFEIQSEITRAIAAQLKSVLGAAGGRASGKLPTQSTEAYNAYLLGNALNRYELNPGVFQRAADAYGEAVAIDPEFAEAHARKATVHTMLAWLGIDVATNARLAEESIERARALAPNARETLVAEGDFQYRVKNDYAGADAAVRAALEESPRDAGLWLLHGSTVRRLGDLDASSEAFERLRALDPKNSMAPANLATNDSYRGNLAGARRWLARAWELSPDSQYNPTVEAFLSLATSDVDAAWRRYNELRTRPGLDQDDVDSTFSDLVYVLRDPARLETMAARNIGPQRLVALDRLGRKDEARALMRDLRAELDAEPSADGDPRGIYRVRAIWLDALAGNAKAVHSGAAALARDPPRDQLWIIESGPALMDAYARIGAPDAAFDLIEQAMDRFGPVHFWRIKTDVAFDPYREQPRYKKLDARYEAWKATQPPAD